MPTSTLENGWRGRVDAKLDEHDRRLDSAEGHPMLCPQVERVADHERRLRLVERAIYIGMGGLFVLNLIGIWKLFALEKVVGK